MMGIIGCFRIHMAERRTLLSSLRRRQLTSFEVAKLASFFLLKISKAETCCTKTQSLKTQVIACYKWRKGSFCTEVWGNEAGQVYQKTVLSTSHILGWAPMGATLACRSHPGCADGARKDHELNSSLQIPLAWDTHA